MSNSNGAFDFHFPENYTKDTLVVSHVGYETYYTPVGQVINKLQRIKLTKGKLILVGGGL